MKKIILCFMVLLLTGCSTTTVKNPNASSLTYKYFKNYTGDVYNLKLEVDGSTIKISKQKNGVYYENDGSMNLKILETGGFLYKINEDKTYSKEVLLKEENYTYGILPDYDLKNKSYKTGKERIGISIYTFETYKYGDGETTYYFKRNKLKYIRKTTSTEDFLYKVLSFDTKKKNNSLKIPKGYVEITY